MNCIELSRFQEPEAHRVTADETFLFFPYLQYLLTSQGKQQDRDFKDRKLIQNSAFGTQEQLNH
jgi:hypothetical protein